MRTPNKKQAWGLDLCGYSNKATLACAEVIDCKISVILFSDHPFAVKKKPWDMLSANDNDQVGDEVGFINPMVKESLYVDCPIDLQKLGAAAGKKFKWELDKRSVDQALKGLSPLASLLGALVTRFRSVLERANSLERVGKNVFETYPAVSLELWRTEGLEKEKSDPYKSSGGIKWLVNDNQWVACDNSEKKESQLAKIVNKLNIVPTNIQHEESLNHHELDAILCALTGVSYFNDDDLLKEVKNRLLVQMTEQGIREETKREVLESVSLPNGYRLCDLNKLKKPIILERKPWPPEG